eukprot:3451474-Prymnesium_polylepis.1
MASASGAASWRTIFSSRQPSGTANRAPSTRATAAPGRHARQQRPTDRTSSCGSTKAALECLWRCRPRTTR